MGNNHGSHKKQDLSFTKSTGLYKTCPWPEKKARELILAKKLAPRFGGSDAVVKSWGECPICFRFYPGFNLTACCSELMCTECYLQVSDPVLSKECPFCSTSSFSVNPVPTVGRKQTGKGSQTKVASDKTVNTVEKITETEEAEAEDNLPVQTAKVDARLQLLHEAQRQSRIVEFEHLSPSLSSSGPSPMSRTMSVGQQHLAALESFMLEEAINESLRISQSVPNSRSGNSLAMQVPADELPCSVPKDVPPVTNSNNIVHETRTLLSTATGGVVGGLTGEVESNVICDEG